MGEPLREQQTSIPQSVMSEVNITETASVVLISLNVHIFLYHLPLLCLCVCLHLPQVLDGAGLDVDFDITSPSGEVLYSDYRKSDGVHT